MKILYLDGFGLTMISGGIIAHSGMNREYHVNILRVRAVQDDQRLPDSTKAILVHCRVPSPRLALSQCPQAEIPSPHQKSTMSIRGNVLEIAIAYTACSMHVACSVERTLRHRTSPPK